MNASIRHVPAGEGPVFAVIGGDIVTCKAAAEDTGGDFTLVETLSPPGAGPPRHVHHRDDEFFYILSGRFQFQVGDQKIIAEAGSFLQAPRDIPHQFANVGDAPGKLLIVIRPAGIEKMFAKLAALPADAPPDFARLGAIAAEHGLEFLP